MCVHSSALLKSVVPRTSHADLEFIRFLQVPRSGMEKEMKGQEKELSDDISNLNKKIKYLEKQYNDAQSQLKDIVRLPRVFSSYTRY